MNKLETFAIPGNYSHTSLLLYAFIIPAFTLTAFLAYKRKQKADLLNKLPGPKTLPLIGNALELNVSSVEFFKVITRKYCTDPGGLTRLWIGTEPYCLVYTASAVETLLSNQKFLDKSVDYTSLQPWLGTGLLTATGAKWHKSRKTLTPTFHFKILEDFIDIVNQQSATFISNLKEKADGNPFNIFTPITLCALDIILETAMGRKINAQDNSDSEYVQALHKMGSMVIKRQTRPWMQPDFLFKLLGYAKEQQSYLNVLHGFSYETIRERRKEKQMMLTKKKENQEDADLGMKTRLAFLDMLLENDTLSDEDIREEVDTFMFEGHDTTTAGINWSIYLIGSHPEIQEKIHEEMTAIFGDSDRPATSADLREMKYLECCIKEALRIFPSVPIYGRSLKENIVLDGYTVPSGTNVMVISYCLHRDPKHFPNPEVFNPERFLPENCVNRHPYAYVPFSAGPRNCIGQKFAMMEEKVVLSSFFRCYRVESVERREELRYTGDLILRPENGTPVKIFPRESINKII